MSFRSHRDNSDSPFASVLTKGTSAEVQISLRPGGFSGPSSKPLPIPLEPFAVNKEMGRILIRRGGETIAAGTQNRSSQLTVGAYFVLGIVLDILS